MQKSKELIFKCNRLIFMSVIIILILESESLAPVRGMVTDKIVFLKGKGTLVSNIFIGILGSAVLTCLNEIMEYRALRNKAEMDILRLYEKWEKDMKHKIGFSANGLGDIENKYDSIHQYWEEVNLIYASFTPFLRSGIYIKLIRVLYEYINVFNDYVENKIYVEKEKEYFTKEIFYYEQLKEKEVDNLKFCDSINELIRINKERLEDLDELVKDEKDVLYEINTILPKVIEMSAWEGALKLLKSRKSVQEEDFKIDMENLKLECKILKYKRVLYRIKRFLRKTFFLNKQEFK